MNNTTDFTAVNTEPDPSAAYPPLPKKKKMGRMAVLVPAPTTAIPKIQEYYGDRFGYDEEGKLNAIEDAFLADVWSMVKAAGAAMSTLKLIASNTFISCDHENKYMPGEEYRSPSPQEVLSYVTEQVAGSEEAIQRVKNNAKNADVLPLFMEDVKIVWLQSFYAVSLVKGLATMENPPCEYNLSSSEQLSFAEMAANVMEQVYAFENTASSS